MSEQKNVISLNFASQTGLLRYLAPFENLITKLSYIDEVNKIYNNTVENLNGGDFASRVLELEGISLDLNDNYLNNIPKTGPLVIVANHPFGGIEGVLIGALIKRVRPDVKIMANYLLQRIPALRDMFIFVDPFGKSSSKKQNLRPLKECLDWLASGGVVVVFPAGTVSHFQTKRMEISDPDWSDTISRILRHSKAPSVPVFFHGQNGWLFQLAGMIHPILRTILLPRELVNKRGARIKVEIGNVIPYEKLDQFETDKDRTLYLRLRTYILGNRGRLDFKEVSKIHKKKDINYDKVIDPIDKNLLQEEIDNLPVKQLLLENGDSVVLYARAHQIPNLLREIGRLREITFRGTNEGTGKEIDLDEYDNYYFHLFIWKKTAKDLVGAYRLGGTDEILPSFGKKGLYTQSLFKYKNSIIEMLNPALEVGRSFIQSNYQRDYGALLLLWKGIGQFIVRNPKYKILFGPVSINNEYETISRWLIINFLKANSYLPHLAEMIKPRNPLINARVKGADLETTALAVKGLDDLSDLLIEMESKQKAVPVLVKQYLKLGGRFIGFNIDPDFGDVLDGLIYVDLTQTEKRILEKYLTKDGVTSFYAYHNISK